MDRGGGGGGGAQKGKFNDCVHTCVTQKICLLVTLSLLDSNTVLNSTSTVLNSTSTVLNSTSTVLNSTSTVKAQKISCFNKHLLTQLINYSLSHLLHCDENILECPV